MSFRASGNVQHSWNANCTEWLTHDWSECGKRCVCCKYKAQNHWSVLVRNKLANTTRGISRGNAIYREVPRRYDLRNIEAQLNCLSQPINSASNDQRIHILGSGAHNDADKCDTIATNEEPAPTEEIWQTTEDCVGKRQSKCSSNVDPWNIGAWPYR